MDNLAKVQEIYAAFASGDIPAILERLDESVAWEYGSVESGVPWLAHRRGRAAVAGFFEALGALDFHSFEPKAFLEGEGIIVVVVDIDATVKKTGKRIIETDYTHVWRFDPAGRIIRFRHCADTYQHFAANQS